MFRLSKCSALGSLASVIVAAMVLSAGYGHIAVKFAPAGAVCLAVRAEPPSGAGGRAAATSSLRFTVTDTGIAMAPEVIAGIFDPFTRAIASTAPRFGGTGLGLTIRAQLVRRAGGEIHVRSEPGKGSEFEFGVQFEPARDETPASRRDELSLLAGRVLVAGGNPVNQELVAPMLEGFGLETVIAGTGLEACEVLGRERFDLMLMDSRLSCMDGFKATATLRAMERVTGRRAPVIPPTAGAMEGDRECRLRAGMDDYLSKPFPREALRAPLARWHRREQPDPRARRASATSPPGMAASTTAP